MPNIGVINEQGYPYEDTNEGFKQLNESEQRKLNEASNGFNDRMPNGLQYGAPTVVKENR